MHSHWAEPTFELPDVATEHADSMPDLILDEELTHGQGVLSTGELWNMTCTRSSSSSSDLQCDAEAPLAACIGPGIHGLLLRGPSQTRCNLCTAHVSEFAGAQGAKNAAHFNHRAWHKWDSISASTCD